MKRNQLESGIWMDKITKKKSEKVLLTYVVERISTIKNGPHSAVGNVSGNRCESGYRSRGREFDAVPVPYFRGD